MQMLKKKMKKKTLFGVTFLLFIPYLFISIFANKRAVSIGESKQPAVHGNMQPVINFSLRISQH